MLKAKLRLDWVPSVSTDVESQKLVISSNGVVIVDEVLDRVISTFSFKVPEHALVGVQLRAYDGTYDSEAATLTFEVGDLGNPVAPTGLGITIEEVVDEE